MRLRVFLFAAALLLALPLRAGKPPHPHFPTLACKQWRRPLLRCEASNVGGIGVGIEWRVYAPSDSWVADYDEGLVVWMTGSSVWQRLEMSYPSAKGRSSVAVRVRWVGDRAHFQAYQGVSPCNSENRELCA